MKWLKSLFGKKKKIDAPLPPIPPFEEMVEYLYDKKLPVEKGEIIKVIYSKDRSKRFIVLKSNKGFYKYICEEICIYDMLDWEYFAFVNNAYPAWWETVLEEKSFFGTVEEAMYALILEAEYKNYFM